MSNKSQLEMLALASHIIATRQGGKYSLESNALQISNGSSVDLGAIVGSKLRSYRESDTPTPQFRSRSKVTERFMEMENYNTNFPAPRDPIRRRVEYAFTVESANEFRETVKLYGANVVCEVANLVLDEFVKNGPPTPKLMVYQSYVCELHNNIDESYKLLDEAINAAKDLQPVVKDDFVELLTSWIWDSSNLLLQAAKSFKKHDRRAENAMLRRAVALEPGYGPATQQFALLKLRFAKEALNDHDVTSAMVHLSELRSFGEPLANHEWLFQGQPLLAQLYFCMGNKAEALRLYKSYLDWRGLDGVGLACLAIACRLGSSLVTKKSENKPGRAYAPPSLMPRIDFRRINTSDETATDCIELSNVSVLAGVSNGSHYQYVLSSASELYLDDLNLHPRYHIGHQDCFIKAVSPRREALIDLSSFTQCVALEGAHGLIGGSSNYYHWLFEYLPRASALLSKDAQIDSLIVHHDIQPYQIQSLELLFQGSFSLTKAVTTTRYDVEKLFVTPNVPPREAALFLRKYFLPLANASKPRRKILDPYCDYRRIFVSRSDADPGRIRVLDEGLLYPILIRHKFAIVRLSDYNFIEQVNLFSRCELIIGAHGAGLSNITFCPPGCDVVELCNHVNVHYTFFEEISRAVGHRHHRIAALGIGGQSGHEEDAPAAIDPLRLDEFIERIVESRSEANG